MTFSALNLLYIPEGVVYSVAFFTFINQAKTYTLDEIRNDLYFSVSNKDQILYVAPDFFSTEEIARLFIRILPEEVDIG